MAIDFILGGVVRINTLDIQVLHICEQVGKAPCNTLIMPDDNAWHSRKRNPDNIVGAIGGNFYAMQADLIPEGWDLNTQMRIIRQIWLPGIRKFS
jgi:hypothetical protein